MKLNLDTTRLDSNRPPKAYNNLQVTDLDPLSAGASTFPRLIEVRTPHSDGAILQAMWTGFPPLAVGDYVVCWRDSTDTRILRVAGAGGATSGELTPADLGGGSATEGQILIYDGSSWATAAPVIDPTTGSIVIDPTTGVIVVER